MGYMHVENLYRNNTIQLFRECYALEKVHGTSAHVKFLANVPGSSVNPGGKVLSFYSGGEKHEKFVSLFNQNALFDAFVALGHPEVVVFGEAYGGKQQGMAATYGPNLKFVVFDVKVGETWLDVPDAADVAAKLGLEFVHYWRVSTDTDALNAARDFPSPQAVRNGIADPKPMEGVVLRPLYEMRGKRGDRVMVKHKRADFSERKSGADTKLVDPAKLQVLKEAEAIADEWVTPMRLTHVLDKLQAALGRTVEISDTPAVIKAMQEDVVREAKGEIVESKDALKAIGQAAAKLFKKQITELK